MLKSQHNSSESNLDPSLRAYYGLGVMVILLVLVIFILSNHTLAFGESLFKASATVSESAPYAPRSLFTQPRPQHVGDIITIQVDETNSQTDKGELKVTRTHQVTENGTSMFNNFFRFALGKIPFVNGDKFSDPAFSFNGMDNSNVLNGKSETTRTTQFSDNITCQVVQVLPNGYLMVQGKKDVMMNKERKDLYVSGIINPYYLDKTNSIKSTQVANLQFLMSGKGVISRQQNDGIASKIYQFFQ